MARNNKLVALNRWKNTRARERSKFAISDTVLVGKAALCGFLAGDGSIKKRTLRGSYRIDVCFFPDDDEMLETYLTFFQQIFGKTPSVIIMKNYYHVEIVCRSIGERLLEWANFGYHTWSMPIFEQRNEKIAWLRAFFSAEGYVGVKSVRVQTTNQIGMLAVSDLLSELGIEHRSYVYEPKKLEHSTVYIVTIMKRQAREKYFNEIGFWHTKKTAALAKALDLKEDSRSNTH